jgi:hypothetical protein
LSVDITVIRGELRESDSIELYADLSSDLTGHLAISKKWTVFTERNIKVDPEDGSYFYDEDFYGEVYEAIDSDVIQIPRLRPGRLFCSFEYTDVFGNETTHTKVFQVLPKYTLTEPDEIIDGDTKEYSVKFPNVKGVVSSWTFLDDNTNISGGNVSNKFDSHGFYPYRLIVDYTDAEYLDESSINWESSPASLLVGVSGGIFDGEDAVRDRVNLQEQIDGDFLVKYRLENDINLGFEIETGYTEDNEAPLVITFEDTSSYGRFTDDPEHKIEYVTVDFGDGEIFKGTDTGFNVEKIYHNSGDFTGTYTVNTLHTLSGSDVEYRQSISKDFSISVNPFFTRWAKEHLKEELYNSKGFKDLIKGWGLQSDRLYNQLKDFTDSIDIEKINDKFIESFFATYGDFEEIAEKIGFESFSSDRDDKFLYFRDYNFFDRLRSGVVTDIEKREFIDYVRDSIKRLQKKGTPNEIESEISRFNILGFFVELWEIENSIDQKRKIDEVFLNSTKTNTGVTYRNVSTPLSDNVNVPIGNNKLTSYIEINSREESVSYFYTDDTETRIIDGKKYAVFNKPNHGVISFVDSSYTVAEDAGVATVVVQRAGSSDGRVTAVYTTVQGTATSNVDYRAKQGRLVWEDGDSSDKEINITLLEDDLFESNEEFVVVLYDPTGGAILGANNSTKVILTSDDPPRIGFLQFTNLLYEVDENVGLASVGVGRYNGFDGVVSVDYSATADTAISGADFTPVTGTLVWSDGDYDPKQILVPIIDDAEIEIDELIRMELSNPGGGATLGTRDNAVLVIKQNDLPSIGEISFDRSSYIFIEDEGVGQLTVNRANGSLGEVSVEYQTQNVTAVAGLDYVSSTGVLTWSDGQSGPKTINIPILDNANFNDDKTFNVLLVNPTTGLELGLNPVTTVTIKDNEQRTFGIVNIRETVYSVGEEESFLVVNLSRKSGSDGVVSVRYQTTPLTASEGVDFVSDSGSVSWFDGDNLDKQIVLSILDDLAYEEVESFSLNIFDPQGGVTIGNDDTAIINIISDEIKNEGVVQFVESTITTAESNEFESTPIGSTSQISIAVERISGADGAATVDYQITDGTAISGSDYTASSATGTLVWTNQDADIKSIIIDILNDGVFESEESIIVSLSNPVGTTLGTNSTATVGIQDTTVGTVEFVAGSYSINEQAGNASVTVRRSGGTFGQLTVDYATADGTATAGVDYVDSNGTLVWVADDATDQIITIPIIDDGFNEGAESFTVNLSNPSTGATLGSTSTTTVEIADDEFLSANGAVRFESSLYSVTESGTQIEVVVQRIDGASGNISVEYETDDGTAVGGVDYITKTGTLTWLNGDNSDKSFFVTILDNTVPSGIGTFKSFDINLSNPTGGALIFIGSTEVKITEDDILYGEVRFNTSSVTVPEISGSVSVGVERISGFEGAISVDYSVVGSTALSGSDFTPVSGTLSWANGISATQFITVPVIQDYITESNELFDISLSNPTNATLGSPSSVSVTIEDSDAEKVWYFDGVDNVVEGSGINLTSDYMVAMWSEPVSGGTVFTVKDPLQSYLNLFQLDFGVTSDVMLNGDLDTVTVPVGLSGSQYNFTSVEVLSGSVAVYNGAEAGILENKGTGTITTPVSAGGSVFAFGVNISGDGSYYDYLEGRMAWFAYFDITGLDQSEVDALRDEVYNSGQVSTNLTSLSVPPELWYRFGNSPNDDITNTIGGLDDFIGSNDADPKNFISSQEQLK